MSFLLSPLFHWSQKRNRFEILRHGLIIMSPGREFTDPDTGKLAVERFPWICLGTTPSTAWGFVKEPDSAEEGWDLWQVNIQEGDHMEVKAGFEPYVREVRILNTITADRVWWVAERLRSSHESLSLSLKKDRLD